jgi:hypothetical protein
VSDVLHRMIEIDLPFRNTRRSTGLPSMSLNAFRAIRMTFSIEW